MNKSKPRAENVLGKNAIILKDPSKTDFIIKQKHTLFVQLKYRYSKKKNTMSNKYLL